MNQELRRLVDDIGRRSFDERRGQRTLPESFDDTLWHNLERTGLARLTSSGDAGPAEAAVVLGGLARYAGAVPIAETDLLAAWLAGRADVPMPTSGPLAIAVADATADGGRVTGTAPEVPWPTAGPMVLAARVGDVLWVGVIPEPAPALTHNLAGEPRGAVPFDLVVDDCRRLHAAVADELLRRGAWARCVQVLGALEAAAESTVAHTRERVQFSRPLGAFQAVQHALAAMAGDLERVRATVALAVAAAADHGFDHPNTDHAVTVAKVTIGRVVGPVTTIAHQLHGAIGVTVEHRLWLSTMRARCWVDEFGSTAHYARRLGRRALAAEHPWDVVIGR